MGQWDLPEIEPRGKAMTWKLEMPQKRPVKMESEVIIMARTSPQVRNPGKDEGNK